MLVQLQQIKEKNKFCQTVNTKLVTNLLPKHFCALTQFCQCRMFQCDFANNVSKTKTASIIFCGVHYSPSRLDIGEFPKHARLVLNGFSLRASLFWGLFSILFISR